MEGEVCGSRSLIINGLRVVTGETTWKAGMALREEAVIERADLASHEVGGQLRIFRNLKSRALLFFLF